MAYMAGMTLTTLLTLLREVLHEYNTGLGAFWTDAALTDFINIAYRFYMVKVETANPGKFVEALTPISVVADTDTYTLPSDVFSLWALRWEITSYDPVIVWESSRFRRLESTEKASSHFTNSPTYVPAVRIRGNSAILHPMPGPESYSNALVPEAVVFPPVLTGSDAVDLRLHPVLHPLIALRAGYLALAEDGTQPEAFRGLTETLTMAEADAFNLMTTTIHPRLESVTS